MAKEKGYKEDLETWFAKEPNAVVLTKDGAHLLNITVRRMQIMLGTLIPVGSKMDGSCAYKVGKQWFIPLRLLMQVKDRKQGWEKGKPRGTSFRIK